MTQESGCSEVKMTVREWLQQGGGFTSALLAFFEEPGMTHLREVRARHDLTNKRRFNNAVHDAAVLKSRGYSHREATNIAMWREWPLLRDLDAEVTHEEFRKCFRNP